MVDDGGMHVEPTRRIYLAAWDPRSVTIREFAGKQEFRHGTLEWCEKETREIELKWPSTNTKERLVFLRANGLISSDDEWRSARAAIRQAKATFAIKTWEETLPKDIVKWAWSVITEKSKEESCVDSERCARVGRRSQWQRFVRDRSCCGSEEWEDIGPDGNRYHLGFNYGH